MVFPALFFALLLTALLVSSIGFKNYVWFISLGYGFSIAAEGLLMLILFRKGLTLGTALCCIVFFLYGCRLGGYLAYRELKRSSYKKNMTGEIKDSKSVPFGVQVAIWVTCALLYATQVSPVFCRRTTPKRSIPAALWIPGSTASSAARTISVRCCSGRA